MGQPVVHFEVVGQDVDKLKGYYSDLFSWDLESIEGGPTQYAMLQREGNVNADGAGIAGGIGEAPEGYPGHVTFYVEVPDVEAALAKAEELGGTRMMGPDEPMEGLVIGLFNDPEGHVVGLVKAA
jgi:uncharacterized protein